MSEMVILDTHIWLWYVNENFDQIPTQWLEQIRQADIVAVCAKNKNLKYRKSP